MSKENDAAKIKRLKEALKKEPIVKRIFKKYDRSPDELDNISIKFAPLEVSAKTINGNVILNENMKDEDDEHILAYMIHETSHAADHKFGSCGENEEPINDDNYLDSPAEQKAFKAQLEYKLDNESKEEVKKYLTMLFDRYDLSRKERQVKLKELLPKGKI